MNVYVSLDMKKIISQIRIWQTKIRHVKNHLAKHDFILNNKSLERKKGLINSKFLQFKNLCLSNYYIQVM